MNEGKDGTEVVSLEAELDLRLRFLRRARLILLTVVCDPELASLSSSLDDSELEDEFRMSASTPGCDSSSMTC